MNRELKALSILTFAACIIAIYLIVKFADKVDSLMRI